MFASVSVLVDIAIESGVNLSLTIQDLPPSFAVHNLESGNEEHKHACINVGTLNGIIA